MKVNSLDCPLSLRQTNWVLQSGSADRVDQLLSTPTANGLMTWERIKPCLLALQSNDTHTAQKLWKKLLRNHSTDLLLLRTINALMPSLLEISRVRKLEKPIGSRIAILLAGELRCLNQNRHFFQALSRNVDIFICTNSAYTQEARSLQATLQIVNSEPSLPIGSMHQWHKLSLALQMVRAKEEKTGKPYTHILKLRTDYHHSQPKKLLKELVAADGLICSSDKVFGGRRDLMLLFEGFNYAIASLFYQKEQNYWPINIYPILKSDESCKWYGMAFPKSLVGEPKTVESLRQILKDGGALLADKLLTWKPESNISSDNYVRFFKGNPLFASEVSFARFLNFNAIPTHTCSGLAGFLRNDRFVT